AAAIRQGAAERGVRPADVQEFQSITGKGARAVIGEWPAALGSIQWMQETNLKVGDLRSRVAELQSTGQTVVLVAYEGRCIGLLGIADSIKATTREAISQLGSAGMRIIMLTGDSQATAEAVARQLGLAEVVA